MDVDRHMHIHMHAAPTLGNGQRGKLTLVASWQLLPLLPFKRHPKRNNISLVLMHQPPILPLWPTARTGSNDPTVQPDKCLFRLDVLEFEDGLFVEVGAVACVTGVDTGLDALAVDFGAECVDREGEEEKGG